MTGIRTLILDMLAQRAAGASVCPSEVARAAMNTGWRKLMPEVRTVARELAREGSVRVTQGTHALDPDEEWRGPIRIRLPR